MSHGTCVSVGHRGLILRTEALAGVPNIQSIISAFIVLVNISTTATAPFLIAYAKDTEKVVIDKDNTAGKALDALLKGYQGLVRRLFSSAISMV